MKELSIEEKARAYDEALERARQFSEHPLQEDSSNIVEYIFPELRESENERTRKEIISFLQLPHKQFVGERKQEKWIAWLEKQGEPKETICDKCKKDQSFHSCQDITALGRCYIEGMNSSNNLESKFKVGDEIRTKNEESLIITRIDRCGYWSEDLLICNFDDADKWELVEQKPAWGEEDENTIKVLMNIIRKSEVIDSIIYTDSLKEKLYDWLNSLKQRMGGKV